MRLMICLRNPSGGHHEAVIDETHPHTQHLAGRWLSASIRLHIDWSKKR